MTWGSRSPVTSIRPNPPGDAFYYLLEVWGERVVTGPLLPSEAYLSALARAKGVVKGPPFVPRGVVIGPPLVPRGVVTSPKWRSCDNSPEDKRRFYDYPPGDKRRSYDYPFGPSQC